MHLIDKPKKIKSLFGRYEECPMNWEIKTFNELFEFLRTGTNSRDDLQENGDIQYIHYGDIHAKWHSVLDCDYEEIPWIDNDKVQGLPFLKDGDLIIADASEDYEGSGASVLLKNVRNRKIVSGLHTIALRNIDNSIVSDFKTYLNSINFVKNQIIAYATGISVYGLSKNNLKKIKVPLPPTEEQQKIAFIISKVDELIQKIEKIIDQTQELKKGLMQRLLTRGIGHIKFKRTKLGMIPDVWNVYKMDDICKIERGKFTHRPRNDPDYYGGKYPFIQTGDIEKSNGLIKTFSQTLNEKGLSVSRLFPAGVIVITIAANIGSTAITTFPVCFPDSVVGISSKRMNIKFLQYYLRTKKGFLESKATISAQHNINLETLRPLLILVPPLEEQGKIACTLSHVDELINKYIVTKTNNEILKKGLMQQLLTGKIRVKV